MVNIYKVYTLLSFWLFVLACPTIITFLDNDIKIVVTNLNEEENQEQQLGKKIKEVAKYIAYDFYTSSYLIAQKNLTYVDCSLLQNSQYAAKIILPPPEQTL